MSETELSKAIQDALAYDRDVWVLRVNSGTMKGGRVKLAPAGTSDLILCVRGRAQSAGAAFIDGYGRFCALEVKDPTGRTSADREAKQGAFRARISALGGYAARIDSVESALEAVMRCKRGED